jgi:iron complex transport system substrate-binding protein
MPAGLNLRTIAALLWTLAASAPAHAVVSVPDDKGNVVTLARPAQRIVSLAPHVTELVFAAGGGDRLVGTVDYRDYPAAAKAVPRIGDNRQFDLERLIALKPDLIVVWRHDAADSQLDALRALGIPLFYSEPRGLDDIPDSLVRLGKLFGTSRQADLLAAQLRQRTGALSAQYGRRAPVRVFYQVWDKPLYTLGGSHIVSDAIRRCGGENIFARLTPKAPVVTVEAVLLEQPDAIISGEQPERPQGGLESWKRYAGLNAVRRGSLYAIDGDLINRPGPRLIDGVAALCVVLDRARKNKERQP